MTWVAEEWGNNLIVYLYDADGSPMGMQYRTSSMVKGTFYTFWFEKNLQGDIVAIYNSSGIKVISYTYDAWGHCTTTYHNVTGTNSYAAYNPFRYRGYYYDSKLGFYYLNSRYYDPAVGRFINADAYISTGQGLLGYNMFAYCNNNPVIQIDPFGFNSEVVAFETWAETMWWLCGVDTALPIGDIIYWGGIVVLGALIWISSAQLGSYLATQSTTSTTTNTDTKTNDEQSDDPAVYYGARVFNHQFEYITPPMTREQAISWAFSESLNFGINSNWGIYTADMEDAFEIFNHLVILNPILEPKESAVYNIIKHYKVNEYPHYHLPGFTFNKRNKHFHIWYGVLGGK